jgi:hypothetical protein
MVLNTTFNHISAISWQSDILVEETGVLEENHHWSVHYIHQGFSLPISLVKLLLKVMENTK